MGKYIVLWQDAEMGTMKMSYPMTLEKAKLFRSNNNYDAFIVKIVDEKTN